MKVDIIRLEYAVDGTFGVLLIDGKVECVTLENPWINNKENISCIPEGRYICEPYTSSKFGETYQALNVPERTFILVHAGNTQSDTSGCVILGSSYGVLNGKRAILDSKKALMSFLGKVSNKLILTIKGVA